METISSHIAFSYSKSMHISGVFSRFYSAGGFSTNSSNILLKILQNFYVHYFASFVR